MAAKFSSADRDALAAVQTQMARQLRRDVQLHISVDAEGADCAAFLLRELAEDGTTALVSVQALSRRRFSLVGHGSRAIPFPVAPVRNVAELEGAAVRAARLALRSRVPYAYRMRPTSEAGVSPKQATGQVGAVRFAKSVALTFTDAERSTLTTAAGAMARKLSRHVTLTTCAEDGDESAAFMLGDDAPEGPELLAMVQLTRDGGRALAIIGANGRRAPRTDPSDSLESLVPQLVRAAAVEFRTVLPYSRASMLAAVVPASDLEAHAAALGLKLRGSGSRKPCSAGVKPQGSRKARKGR